ncbi:hypothetical protein G5B10_14910 [Fluviicola sp. SGL-29]|nr:hypothetical protein [Fluviicola sp. SGL-29]
MKVNQRIQTFNPILAHVLLYGIMKLSGVKEEKTKRVIELAKVAPREAFLMICKKINPKYLYDLSFLLREIHQIHQTLI